MFDFAPITTMWFSSVSRLSHGQGAQHHAIEHDYTCLRKSSYLRGSVKARLRHDDATSTDALQQPAVSASGYFAGINTNTS